MHISWDFWECPKSWYSYLSFLPCISLCSWSADLILRCSAVLLKEQQSKKTTWAWPRSSTLDPEMTTFTLFARKSKPFISSNSIRVSLLNPPQVKSISQETPKFSKVLWILSISSCSLYFQIKENMLGMMCITHIITITWPHSEVLGSFHLGDKVWL